MTADRASLLEARFRVLHLEPQGWTEQFTGSLFPLIDWLAENTDREWFERGEHWRIEIADRSVGEPVGQEIWWKDVREGDELSLLVMDRQEGLVREQRSVVAVDWPKITLAEGGRVYEIDATAPDSLTSRSLRRMSSVNE